MHQKLVGLLASLVLATASVVVMAPPATADGGVDWINGVQFSGASPLPQSLHPNRWGEKSYAGRVLLTSWLN